MYIYICEIYIYNIHPIYIYYIMYIPLSHQYSHGISHFLRDLDVAGGFCT